MEDKKQKSIEEDGDEMELLRRRDFLHGLMKWSSAVIGSAVFGTVIAPADAQAGWVNRRGSWVNGAGPGGWANRGASWVNGGGGWLNGRGGGGGWVNRRGGGGAWVNR